MKEWVKDLKVGDKVIISSSREYARIEKVIRLTKTLVITENDSFKKESRVRPGDAYHFTFMNMYTYEKEQEIKQDTRKKMLVNRFDQFNWDRLKVPVLEKIYKLVHKGK